MRRAWPRWQTLLALPLLLGAGACTTFPGEEPLYVLRDSMGRAVAMAGRTQLGDAAPGTTLRANIAGVEQEVMVGERVGQGSVLAPRPAAPPAEEVAAAATAPTEELAAAAPVTAISAEQLDAPAAEAPAPAPAPATRRVRAAAAEAGANPSGRRRGPPPASVSRSVM